MITEDHISFETAKLMKEKGFDEETRGYYPIKGDATGRLMFGSEYNHNHSQVQISAPTLQMAIKYLREVHSLYIDIVTSFSQNGICYTFSCSNTMDLIQGTKGISYHEYQTYEEACEEAIKYCLENLI